MSSVTTSTLPLSDPMEAPTLTLPAVENRRLVHPQIDVEKANALPGTVVNARLQGDQFTFPSPMTSSILAKPALERNITPPSIPVLRVSSSDPSSSHTVAHVSSRARRRVVRPSMPDLQATAAGPISEPRVPTQELKRVIRRVVSVPAQFPAWAVGTPGPLTDGPMGWRYTPVDSRPVYLESYLPPERYHGPNPNERLVRPNKSTLSLVVSLCGPGEEQVVVATPGAVHTMTMEKKKGRKFQWFMKGARKVRGFFKRSS